MMTHIALLRGINVGGNVKVAMSDLRELLAEHGFGNVRTLLQSGNVVFSSDATAGPELERRLEAAVAERFGLRIDVLVRSAAEWAAAIAANPFPDEAERDPSHLLVTFLKTAPEASAVAALRASVSGPEVVRADERQLYIVYPAGIGRLKLTHASIESKLRTRGTSRNWNTVLKLDALARD